MTHSIVDNSPAHPNEYNEIEKWLSEMTPLPDLDGKTQRRDMIYPASKVVEKLKLLAEYFESQDKHFTITDDGTQIRCSILSTDLTFNGQKKVKRIAK
jgi:hypothetical protein